MATTLETSSSINTEGEGYSKLQPIRIFSDPVEFAARVQTLVQQNAHQLEEARFHIQHGQIDSTALQRIEQSFLALQANQVNANLLMDALLCELREQLEQHPIEISQKKPLLHRTFLLQQVDQSKPNQDNTKRSPKEMIRTEYKGRRLSSLIEAFLRKENGPLTTAELTRKIYQTETKEEFARARNIIYAELRSGLLSNNPLWRKVGRYAYEIA